MPFEANATYAFGEVALVPFPFTDQTAVKKRPAVVISGAEYNRLTPDMVMMPITSQLRAVANFGEVWIDEWKEANLLKPSAIKPQIATIKQTLVIKRMGHMQPMDVSRLRSVVSVILGEVVSAQVIQ
jgi:mRNA interferase MazF